MRSTAPNRLRALRHPYTLRLVCFALALAVLANLHEIVRRIHAGPAAPSHAQSRTGWAEVGR